MVSCLKEIDNTILLNKLRDMTTRSEYHVLRWLVTMVSIYILVLLQ